MRETRARVDSMIIEESNSMREALQPTEHTRFPSGLAGFPHYSAVNLITVAQCQVWEGRYGLGSYCSISFWPNTR